MIGVEIWAKGRVPPGTRRAPFFSWHASIRVSNLKFRACTHFCVMYAPTLQACAYLGETCACLTQQKAFQCIVLLFSPYFLCFLCFLLLFSMISSAFLHIDSCLLLLCSIRAPLCLEATPLRFSNGGLGSIL